MTFYRQTHCQNGHYKAGPGYCKPCRAIRERRQRLNNEPRAVRIREYRKARNQRLNPPKPRKPPPNPFPKKTHCLRGHARTPDNVDKQGRCRACYKNKYKQYEIARIIRDTEPML